MRFYKDINQSDETIKSEVSARETDSILSEIADEYIKIHFDDDSDNYHVILADASNNQFARELWDFHDCEPRYLEYSPVTIHYISKLLLAGKISRLTVYASDVFFRSPLLSLCAKKAIEKNGLKIWFDDLHNFVFEADRISSKTDFDYTQLIHALDSFDRSTTATIESMDWLHDTIMGVM